MGGISSSHTRPVLSMAIVCLTSAEEVFDEKRASETVNSAAGIWQVSSFAFLAFFILYSASLIPPQESWLCCLTSLFNPLLQGNTLWPRDLGCSQVQYSCGGFTRWRGTAGKPAPCLGCLTQASCPGLQLPKCTQWFWTCSLLPFSGTLSFQNSLLSPLCLPPVPP